MQCPLCDAPAASDFLEKNGYRIAKCKSCGGLFCANAPADPAALYSEAYFTAGGTGYADYVGDERSHRRQAQLYLDWLREAGIDGGALLDVGCAAGFFLDEARQHGFAVRGCEVSEYAARHARETLGLDVVCASFLTAELPEQSFDVVTMFNVLEHLPELRRVVAKLEALVRPGGHVAIETWNPESLVARALGRAWHQFSPPHVLWWFTQKSLSALFPRWRLVSYRPSKKWISVGHGLSLLGASAPAGARSIVERAARSRLGAAMLPYFAGDLVFAVLQRAE